VGWEVLESSSAALPATAKQSQLSAVSFDFDTSNDFPPQRNKKPDAVATPGLRRGAKLMSQVEGIRGQTTRAAVG
jgi:hypothetical protein